MVEEQIEDETMSTSTTAGVILSFPAQIASASHAYRRRRIDPRSGHALEILGHAIEYLTDEFVHHGGSLSLPNAQLEAVQLLMARNREIYFACPEIPTFRERCNAFFHRHQHGC